MKRKSEFTIWFTSRFLFIVTLLSWVSACTSSSAQIVIPTVSSTASVPKFDHIAVITFENKDYNNVIGNLRMPIYNRYAGKYTVLTQFYAITHPSLPNYLAMIGGQTYNIDKNCNDCFVDALSLPDLIEASGRTWKAYQENMQIPCALGSQGGHEYAQRHNPFVYFNSIRLDKARCNSDVVPLKELQADIDAGKLPNFIFVTPNLCNDAHNCELDTTDAWLQNFLNKLLPALQKEGPNYLVVLNWDEGQDNSSCCGLPRKAGGRVPVVLISPLAKHHFEDPTPYTHYSLLKTISKAWDLPYLGHAADEDQMLILAPWQ